MALTEIYKVFYYAPVFYAPVFKTWRVLTYLPSDGLGSILAEGSFNALTKFSQDILHHDYGSFYRKRVAGVHFRIVHQSISDDSDLWNIPPICHLTHKEYTDMFPMFYDVIDFQLTEDHFVISTPNDYRTHIEEIKL